MKSYLLKFAQEKLNQQISELNIKDEVRNFILNINDFKLKGQVFNFVKKNPEKSLLDVQNFVKELDLEAERKNKLQLSELPENWLKLHDSLNNPKLKNYLRFLGRAKKLPEYKEEYKEKLNKILHYISEVGADEDINIYSLDELYEIAEDWEKSFKNSLSSSYEKVDIIYGPEWKNKDFNGFYIVEITTENDLKLEGKLLNHCVGGYFHKIKNNQSKIFSLRNPSGKPEVTIEVSPDMFKFKQTFGYSNNQPSSGHMSMINEWKQSLHSQDKIIQLATSKNISDRISAAEFMDYSNPIYAFILSKMVHEEVDSGTSFYGSPTSNQAQDVLQALAANETLPEQLYEIIYAKCKSNISTIFNLIRNIKCPNNLFKKIYQDNDSNEIIIKIIASSIAISRDENKEVLEKIVNNYLNNKNIVLIILNNPSIKSSAIKNILSKLSEDVINKLFEDEKIISNFEPKLIDDLLESNNPFVKNYYFKVLINNENINEKLLAKFAKKFGVHNKYASKEKIIINELQKDPLKLIDINLGYLKSLNLTSEQINILLNKNYDYINEDLAKNTNLTSEQINVLLKKDNNIINRYLAKNPNLTSEQINVLLKKDNNIINRYLAKNPNLTAEQFNILLNKNDYINNNLSQNPNLTAEQINILLNKDDDYINQHLAKNPNLTVEQINVLLNKNNNYINENLALNRNLSAEKINIILKKNDNYINQYLAPNSNLTVEQINILLNKDDDIINRYLALNPNLTSKQINILLKQNSDIINQHLAKNPNLTAEQFNILLNKNDNYINENLAINPNLTSEQINVLLKKDGKYINQHLAKNPNLTVEQINVLLNKNNNYINENLTQNSNLTVEQINILLNKNNDYINDELAQNPNLSLEQCIKLLKYKPVALPKYFNKTIKQSNKFDKLQKLALKYYKLSKLF